MTSDMIRYLTITCALAAQVAFAQTAVIDAANLSQSSANHAQTLSQWTQQIQQATETVNKLNSVVSNLNNVQGLLGTGMGGIGLDPSITAAIDLSKSLNNFGQSLQSVQHTVESTTGNIEGLKQAMSDPQDWARYLTLAKSYNATQDAQKLYDTQMSTLNAQRKAAEEMLKAQSTVTGTAKAQAQLDSVDAAQRALMEEKNRAFQQQQANYIENQNQKAAMEQAQKDWFKKENDTVEQSFQKNINNLINQ